jgi:Ca2+-binding RTX toxin-like protein
VNRLLDQYDSFGGVAVRLVTFNDVGEAVGTQWTSVADARLSLQNLLTGGGTNYDSALSFARSAWASDGKIAGAQNTLYFLSDGQPVPFARGIDAAEEASWTAFLDDNQIRAFSVGLGADAAQGPLNPVAYDGQIGENADGILVSDFDQLDDALAATVPTVVGNPLLPGGTFDLPTSGIGADGGRVLSVTFGSTTYTFDPANGGAIVVTGGPDRGVFDTTTDTLTVTTTAGGAFAIDLVNGRYSYSGPPSIGAPIVESFGYVVVDGDGDTSASNVSVEVERVTVQVGTPAADTLNGGTGQDFIIARGGNDTVSGSDNADRLAGHDGDDTLAGGAGHDALFGGAGDDRLDGGTGNDTLDGGVGADRLSGDAGADVFAWTLADRGAPGTPAIDTITDFDAASAAPDGDVLDLRDLLVGETGATLERFLDFDVGVSGTTIRVSSTGGFAGGTYSSGAEDQRIVLEGVDIRAALGLAAGASDATILQALVDCSKLLVDAGA